MQVTRRFSAITLPAGKSAFEPLVALLLIWMAFVTMGLLIAMAYERASMPGYDFRYFWVAGKVWSQGISPYGGPFIETAPRLISLGHVPEIWPYPPNLWLPSVGLAMFDINTAWAIWLTIQFVAIVAASAALAFLLPVESVSSALRQSVQMTRLGVFCVHMALMTWLEAMQLSIFVGQISVLIYLCVVLMVCGLARGWHGLVVVCLAITFMKPQIGAVLALAMLLSGRQGFRLVAMSALLSLVLIFPPFMAKSGVILDWLREIGDYDGVTLANMAVSVTGIRHLGWIYAGIDIGSTPALGITFLACTCVGLYLLRSASKTGEPWHQFAPDVVVAQILVILAFSPLHMYDFVLFGVVVLVVVQATGLRLIAALMGAAMFIKPTDVFDWLYGGRAITLFPGSTMVTIGALILLLVSLTRAREPQAA